MIAKHITILVLSVCSAVAAAHPSNGLPTSIYAARESSGGPDPARFGSYAEMAADPEIQRLFKQWLGVAAVYANRAGIWKQDNTMTRAHSYTGLVKNRNVSCHIDYAGQSRFTRYGQARDIRNGKWLAAITQRGGPWPAWDAVTPQKQAQFESYCELFHQLAPSWIEMGLLEH